MSTIVRQSVWSSAILLLLAPPTLALAQRVYHEDFEKIKTSWTFEKSDASYQLLQHDRSRDAAHTGKRGERLHLRTGKGQLLVYRHPVNQARVLEELRISLWIKTTHPGIQLSARIVIPGIKDPDTGQPLKLVLDGDRAQSANRWEQLVIEKFLTRLRQPLNVARARLRRDISLRGAYLESILLNLHVGESFTEVRIDDLQLTPLVNTGITSLPGIQEASTKEPPLSQRIERNHHQILIDGHPFQLRMARYRGETLTHLKAAGFNTVMFDQFNPSLLQQAEGLRLAVSTPPPQYPSKQSDLQSHPLTQPGNPYQSVLLWNLGFQLQENHFKNIQNQISHLRNNDPFNRPVLADIYDSPGRYSSELDLVGMHRKPMFGSLSLLEYHRWMKNHAQLTRPGKQLWTWIQTELPHTTSGTIAIQTNSTVTVEAFPQAVVEPEQIRLMAYTALSAGYQNLGFDSIHPLISNKLLHNKERLRAVALLNMELQLIQPLLADSTYIGTVTADPPDIKAAMFRGKYGLLVIPVWYSNTSHFVPSQHAANNVSIVIPGAPNTSHAWEIQTSGLRSLRPQRISGGTKIEIEEFGLTSLILLTSDRQVLSSLRSRINNSSHQAAHLHHDLASAKLQRVRTVQNQLLNKGHALNSSNRWLQLADQWLQQSARALGKYQFQDSQHQSSLSMRSLRLLQHAQWNQAISTLTHPAESPFTLCYTTLPLHFQFQQDLHTSRFSHNLLEAGTFENFFQVTGQGWRQIKYPDNQFKIEAEVSTMEPHAGRFSLRLSAQPKETSTPLLSHPSTLVKVTTHSITVPKNEMLQITGWIRIPIPLKASVDGVTLSNAGSPYAHSLKWQSTDGWKPFKIYWNAPEDGKLKLELALTGLGDVFFDDLSIHSFSLPIRSALEKQSAESLSVTR